MARKHKHEDHTNHEAWAIPYGDLITLLLALFVCMYAISSVNEGKYRVLADSLSQAFGGPPKSIKPVQFGDKPEKGAQEDSMLSNTKLSGFEQEQSAISAQQQGQTYGEDSEQRLTQSQLEAQQRATQDLQRMSEAVERAMEDLITQQLVTVRRSETWLEIEIRTDILYSSGSSRIATDARPVLERLAAILKPFPNPVRIEGHTDNVPISTAAFPSNWELSAARAASVVTLFTGAGVDPTRMTVAGMGQYRPVGDNSTEDGRNHNRRVVVVVGAEPRNDLPQVEPETAPGALVPSPGASAAPVVKPTPVATGKPQPPAPPAAETAVLPSAHPPAATAPTKGPTVVVPSGTLSQLQGGVVVAGRSQP